MHKRNYEDKLEQEGIQIGRDTKVIKLNLSMSTIILYVDGLSTARKRLSLLDGKQKIRLPFTHMILQ